MIKNKPDLYKEHIETAMPAFEKETESPEVLKEGLVFLLNRYLDNKSRVIAKKIVVQIEKLLRHSDCIGFPNERCGYYRLLNFWRAKCL